MKGGNRGIFASERKLIASDSTFARALRWLRPQLPEMLGAHMPQLPLAEML